MLNVRKIDNPSGRLKEVRRRNLRLNSRLPGRRLANQQCLVVEEVMRLFLLRLFVIIM